MVSGLPRGGPLKVRGGGFTFWPIARCARASCPRLCIKECCRAISVIAKSLCNMIVGACLLSSLADWSVGRLVGNLAWLGGWLVGQADR